MKLILFDQKTGGNLLLFRGEQNFDRLFYSRDKEKKYYTIAWNHGEKQSINIDGVSHNFMPHTIIPLMFNQSFNFERPAEIVAWQFNREFYCIVDHDAEVSCAGFLFAMGEHLSINLDDPAQYKLKVMLDVFIEELNTQDSIQYDMLIMLLKRLIIIITGLARNKYIPDPKLHDQRLDVFRKFNVLVEKHFHAEHTVAYYAGLLNKSPKTLSNIFALYNNKSPQQIIRERIIIEAKRLLCYTNKSVKQITYNLGFEDPAYFSNFFKKHTSLSPLEFRNNRELEAVGK
ncbi:MAG TPA: helix-turn-helix domain-containing protein [Puia sp.]|jgi:AraC-like DNA-binding protein